MKNRESEQMLHTGRERQPEPMPPRMLAISRLEVVSVGYTDTGITDEVMLLIKEVQGFDIPFPLFAPFTTPAALKVFIEELIAFRHAVWADAEPVNVDAKLPEEDK